MEDGFLIFNKIVTAFRVTGWCSLECLGKLKWQAASLDASLPFFSSQVSIVILCTIYFKLTLVKNDIPLPPWVLLSYISYGYVPLQRVWVFKRFSLG